MIVNIIDEYLTKRPRKARENRCFHPSTLHLPAQQLYEHYFSQKGEEEIEPRLMRIFDNGHGVHERIQQYLREAGLLVQAEVPVRNDEYEIVGTCDGIIEIGGKRGVIEIKSINANGFYCLYGPKPEHLIQLNIYCFCTGIPRGIILYECKDNQELKEFFVRREQSVFTPVLKKIKYVQECIRQGKEPK